MEYLGPLIASGAIAAITVFGGFQTCTEAHPMGTAPPSESMGYNWTAHIVKSRSSKNPVIFAHPELAVGLLTFSVIGAYLRLRR